MNIYQQKNIKKSLFVTEITTVLLSFLKRFHPPTMTVPSTNRSRTVPKPFPNRSQAFPNHKYTPTPPVKLDGLATVFE